MNQELQNKLLSNYPKIFRDLSDIECGDGWYTLLDKLCNAIQSYLDYKENKRNYTIKHNERVQAALNGDLQPLKDYYAFIGNVDNWVKVDIERGLDKVPDALEQIVAEQIKEKFGALRFYILPGGDEYIDGMIHMAQNLSIVICEVCGKPGHRRDGSWILTLCDGHANEDK